MRLKLLLSKKRYAEVKKELLEKNIEIDDDADLILSEENMIAENVIVRNAVTKEKINLSVEDIVYIETYGHNVEVHTSNDVYESEIRLYKWAEKLDSTKFLRVSNSVLIAKKYVKSISPTLSMKFILTMANSDRVDVTRSYYYIFKEFFGI